MKSKICLYILVIFTVLGASLILSFDFITNKTLTIAHRGFGIFNKNTISAFKSSKQFDAIECDIWVTSDNEFIVNHDQTIKTTDGKTLSISNATLSELKNKSHNIVTLDDYLSICKDNNNRCVIDIKSYTLTESQVSLLIQKLKTYKREESALILSYSQSVIKQFKDKTTAELYFIFDNNNDEHISFCIDNGINACVKTNAINKNLVTLLHEKGLKVNAWTVNDIFTYMYLSSIGVDYITSDLLF